MFPSRHRNGDNPSTSFLPPLSAKVGRPTDLSVSTEVKFQTVPRENATARCIPDISSQSENPLSRYNQLQLSRNTKGSISTALGPGRRISKANLGQRQVRLQTFRRNDAALQRLLQSRRQREQFRKKLVDIILFPESSSNSNQDDSGFFNSADREKLRYYYYIHNGINTELVAPLATSWLSNILSLVPDHLKVGANDVISSLCTEVKTNYLFCVKKAIGKNDFEFTMWRHFHGFAMLPMRIIPVDFVLGESKRADMSSEFADKNKNCEGFSNSDLSSCRRKCPKLTNLHITNICLLQIHDLWYNSYRDFTVVNVAELKKLKNALDLPTFIQIVNNHIDQAKSTLNNKWLMNIQNILTSGNKKHLPVVTKKRKFETFFEATATLMCIQLQQMCFRSIEAITDFLCIDESCTHPHSPGFVIQLILEETELRFEPGFEDFEVAFLSIYDAVVATFCSLSRVEQKLYPDWKSRNSGSSLKPIILEEIIANAKSHVSHTVHQQSVRPKRHAEMYKKHDFIINQEISSDVEKFLSENHTFEEYAAQVEYYSHLAKTITIEMIQTTKLGLFEIHCGDLIQALVRRTESSREKLLNRMTKEEQDLCIKLCHDYEQTSEKMLAQPVNTDQLMDLKKYVDEVEKEIVNTLKDALMDICKRINFLIDYVNFSPAEMRQNNQTFNWHTRLPELIVESRHIMSEKRQEFEEALRINRHKFIEELHGYAQQVEDLTVLSDVREMTQYLEKAQQLNKQLEACDEKIRNFNSEERAFGWTLTEYPQKRLIVDKLSPYLRLYETAVLFDQRHKDWFSSPLMVISADAIEQEIAEFWKNIYKLERAFADVHVIKIMIQKMKMKVEELKEHLPLIQALCNPGLRDRHWEQISEVIGFPLKSDQEMTLARIIDLNLDEFVIKFEAVSEAASKEHNLEKALHKMIQEWEIMEFCIIAYRDTGTSILSSMDDIQQLLDDHIVKTQSMKSSPFVKPFERELSEWEAKLSRLQEIVDEWLRVQTTWMYLEPIFTSPDIMSQMPEEGRRFSTVDKHWRDIMKFAVQDKHVLAVLNIERILERLKKSNELLDLIQKGLNHYLEKKRLAFPRFFFLSNDELLEILSETKDPTRVQPHLRKCFEGIVKLQFEEQLEVTHLISNEGEVLPLDQPVGTSKARGQVELWLKSLEQAMLLSVQKMIFAAHDDYSLKCRDQWILSWPGQGILCVSQLMWTAEVHVALQKGSKELKNYLQENNNRIDKVVDLVRQPLDSQKRHTLGALVVLDVHARDIVSSLIEKGITNESDFHWQSQLRYYVEEEKVVTKMITTSIKYGCEYLGNTGRLVITPLTDRCYRTMFSALHLHLGCAPEGPAGTGKTETTKDLAKAVAKHCVVFNCSESMDYISLGKFFKGLAASGAWSCFDEFNRIDMEVLSVVAQQILTIQRGIHARADSLVIGGTEVKLDPSCAVFVTMNPTYSGRSELPDNLKALFRPIAMMVPDYKMIAEIALYSYGFKKARDLALKIVSLYRLCAEQLSSQSHYDYGMRAVKSVLTAVGMLKIEHPRESEDVLVLQAILNVNLPKFLPEDVPLFNAIVSDLFPGIALPSLDFSALDSEIRYICEKKTLQCTTYFLEKIHQVYETIGVRQGVMIVGSPLAGKTKVYQVLAEALGSLHEKGLMNENKVHITVINPKALSLGRLYGQFDSLSHEWADGIIAVTFRTYATSSSPDRKWIVFDGPVETAWIENMNTVLDDNKKLCLMSGEVMPLSAKMNLIFETMDLENASPATVSRCGMVYMEPQLLGWTPLMHSWIKSWPSVLTEEHKLGVMDLFEYFCPPLLHFLRYSGIREIVHSTNMSLVFSLIQLMDCFICELEDSYSLKSFGKDEIHSYLTCSFVFSCVWSLGGRIDEVGRVKFDAVMRSLIEGNISEEMDFKLSSSLDPSEVLRHLLPVPKEGLVFDYRYVVEGRRHWAKWSDFLKSVPPIPRDIPPHQIIVPTPDTNCFTTLLGILMAHRKPCLFVGPSGTGKSILIQDFLNHLNVDEYKLCCLNFSAHISSSLTQDVIMSKLDKRRKGVYGPSLGKKLVIFIDDLNLPVPEPSGAQPPIELLRLWLDQGVFYDGRDNAKLTLLDMQIITAMGMTGGGCNPISPRFMRHFNVISVNKSSDETMKSIFSKIIMWHLDTRGFGKEFDPCTEQMINGTLEIHNLVLANLLPTPTKSHYLFNLRDISRVVQGILFSVPETMEDIRAMKRLWTHEVLRVYYDRLVEPAEKSWFFECLRRVIHTQFKEDFDYMFQHLLREGCEKVTEDNLRGLVFCDFSDPKSDVRNYVEVQDLDNLKQVVDGYLEEYNNVSKKPMNLVMFRFAIEHLSRISRIMKQPCGHALLVGVGGSGRQSLTRLASHASDYELHQLEITRNYSILDWKDDLKHILIKTASDEKQHILFLSDTQIKDEAILEDINNFLNSGEIPNLFNFDEKQEISDRMRDIDRQREKPQNPEGDAVSMYNLFVQTVRHQLHVVLAMSPAGDSFRDRLRKFPCLISNCTVDWFQPWPEDALQAVASQFLTTLNLEASAQEKCAVLCQMLHTSVQELSKTFYQEMKRPTYITPASYLDHLSSFKTLLMEQREEVLKSKKRYEMGIDKLELASRQVTAMQNELSTLQPQLIEASKEVDDIMNAVEKDSVEVAEVEKIVKMDEAQANERAQSAQSIKEECNLELAKAIPILDAAVAALNILTNNDITIVKTMKNPPSGVKLVMESICILKGVKNDRITDPSGTGKMIDDYWGPSKRLLGDMKFLESLMNFDKDNIPPKTMKLIREKYITNPDFDPEKIKAASAAAEGLCKWVISLEVYDRMIKEVAPKKEALQLAEADLAVALESLKEKQAKLQAVQTKLQELTDVLGKNKQHKLELETQVDQCTLKLERAQQLLSRLGGETTRWSDMASKLGKRFSYLTGDILLASGIIAYLGPFTADYRQTQISQWIEMCNKMNLPCSPNFSISTVLGDPVTIQSWKIAELPVDAFSVDNAIIVSNSHKWPLMIDPQNQANRWIRNMEKSSGLKVLKATDQDYLRTLEVCIQSGKPALLENVGEDIDPALESVLLKQTFKHGATFCVKVGENIVEYSPNFRLYLTTQISNPHYLPEISMKVTLVNFMITPSGLQDQLLGLVVAREKPDLEEERRALIVQGADNKRQLKEIEDKILEVLSTSQGNILDDETAIKVLSSSKILANEILQKQATAEVTERKIEDSRQGYLPITIHASGMFFTIASLATLDHMYYFSLPWFINLFISSIDNTEKFEEIDLRLACLKEHFTQSLHESVCHGLFQKDKFLFTFLLSINQLRMQDQISEVEWNFFLTGGKHLVCSDDNPTTWLPDNAWMAICNLVTLPIFDELKTNINTRSDIWKQFYENEGDAQYLQLPFEWESKLNKFQKLILLKCVCPYKVLPYIQDIIIETLGPGFIDLPPFDLGKAFADSSCCTPIILLLSQGVDPIVSLMRFAEEMGFGGSRLNTLSLGQGQGPIAVEMVQEAAKMGTWVVLQNCHLAKSWMSALDKLCEDLSPDTVHPDFRLWLTTYSCSYFPMGVLYRSIKITNESLSSLKASMTRAYMNDPIANPEFFYAQRPQQAAFQKLLFGLCCFHTMVKERCKFQSLGWNMPYEFSETDLQASIEHLSVFLQDSETVPLEGLLYTIGVCTYGGRLTDSWDVRTLMALLKKFFSPHFFNGHKYSLGNLQITFPSDEKYESYVNSVKALPASVSPEVLGLHPNARITTANAATGRLLEDVLQTQLGVMQMAPRGLQINRSPHEIILEVTNGILEGFPQDYDLEEAQKKFPPSYDESFNIILIQEMGRYNSLLQVIRRSLQKVQRAVQGYMVMPSELEEVADSILKGKVPKTWLEKSYPSLKSLRSYIQDLFKRVEFFKKWYDSGPPTVFWISGLYFIQAFLTAVQQSYARRHKISIDSLVLECEVLEEDTVTDPPESGVYVHGLFLEGARWDRATHQLTEAYPMQLFDPMPAIWLKPTLKTNCQTKHDHVYLCPVYQTSERWGVLSTTGHSTNYMFSLNLQSLLPEDHWICRGVALLCQLQD